MTHLTNIMKKELRELLTPGSIMSVVLMVFLFAALGGLVGDGIGGSLSLPSMGVVNFEDQTIVTEDGEWDAYKILKAVYIYNGVPESEIDNVIVVLSGENLLEQMEERGLRIALVMSDTFASDISNGMQGIISQYYVYHPSGMVSGTVSMTSASTVISILNGDLSKFLIGSEELAHHQFLSYPISGGWTYTYVNGVIQEGITPADLAQALTGQSMLIPMIIMIVIMMVGSIVISSMGSEKENKTLETLLTLPIKRSTIVTGKILAAAVVGLLFGLAYMVGISLYVNSMTSMAIGGTDIDIGSVGLTLNLTDYILLMISMFLAIACALGICMILGAFAKNYKSAQTMTMPLAILVIIPMFVIMFTGFNDSSLFLKVLLFAIPFSHPMMATDMLLNGNVTFVLIGIAYMIVFAIVSILITVRLYNSDILVTGLSQNKYVERITGSNRASKKKKPQ